MTLTQLEYVLALDEFRHFQRAAESCFVSQPTLSVAVRKLEEEMGVEIFDRGRKPLEPTPVGSQVIEKIRLILNEVDQLKAWVSGETESVEGRFTLGVIPTIAPYLLPVVLPHFTNAHPETHLSIRELQTAGLLRGLKQGTIDLAILATPLEESELREVAMYYEPFKVFVHPERPLEIPVPVQAADLPGKGLIMLEEGHCFRSQSLSICEREVPETHRGFTYESGSIEGLKQMVRNGMGYTLVPELSLEARDETFVRSFADPEPVREISLVVHRSFAREALLEALRNSVLESIPRHFQQAATYRRVRWR